MKHFFLLLATLTTLLVTLSGCSHVLEKPEVASERVRTQAYANGVTYIEVSGLASREGMGVATIQTERVRDNIFIKVKLGYLADGCQPHFLERVPIVTGNEQVFFGEDKVLIWPIAAPAPVEVADVKEIKVKEGYGK
jgi:hypothetical protein